MVIWKFTLRVSDVVYVDMPRGSAILSIQLQGLDMCMWALVDPLQPEVERAIEVLGTGQELPEPKRGMTRHYLATVQDTPFVWHFFELLPQAEMPVTIPCS